jgi:hypothetical protein
MASTDLSTFQTQYNLDFSSASGTLGFAKHFFQSNDIASEYKM